MERVSDLRRVAQAGKDTDPAGYRIHRRISIYLTWWLLRLGVSANQASLLMMIVGAAGAMLLASPRLGLDAVGFSLLYVAFLLDKVDGEIARCRGSESPRGILLDRFHHRLVEPAVFAAAAWREYGLTSSATPLVAGFATMLFANIIEENQQLAPFILHKRLREGGRLPPGPGRARSRALARAAALLRPLKLFRMQIGALPLLAAAYVVEAATGRPAPAWCLLASAAGLGAYLVFQ